MLENRVDEILDLISRLAAGRLSERGHLQGADGAADAIIAGLNMLADELQSTAEDARRKAEHKHRILFETAHDAILIADAETGILQDCNDAACRFFGKTKDQLIGQHQRILHPQELRHGEFAASYKKHLDQLHRQDSTANITKVIAGNGSLRDVSIVSNIIDWDGRTVIQGVFRDITEQKKAEENFRNMVEHAPDGVVVANPDGRILDVNPEFCRLLGYSREELLSLKASALVSARDAETRGPRFVQRIAQGETVLEKWNFKRKDGSYIPIELSSRLLSDGRMIAHVRDLTERLQQEKELYQAQAVIENSLTPITVASLEGLVYANPAALKLWGYDSSEEFLGVGGQAILAERCHEKALEITQHVLKTGAYRSIGGELFAMRKDGTEIELAFHRTLLRGPDGIAYGTTTSWLDITELRQLEKEKARMQAQLIHSSKLAAIGTLAAGVAHEINNPLTIIMGNINYLRSCLAGAIDPAEIEATLAKQDSAAQRIANIVNGLRAFARSDSAAAEIIDLHQVITDTLSFSEMIFRKENITVEKDFCSDRLLIRGNTGRIQQVLLNLLTNARDATQGRPGGGIVRIRTQALTDAVLLEVTDNGTGIENRHLSHIFDPFFTTKPQGKGTGLGLSIVHSIVEGFGGKITVSSQLGIGTKFSVFLLPPEGAPSRN